MGISSMPEPRDSLLGFLVYNAVISIAALAGLVRAALVFLDLGDWEADGGDSLVPPGGGAARPDPGGHDDLRRGGGRCRRRRRLQRVPGRVRGRGRREPAPLRPPLPPRVRRDLAPVRARHVPALPRPPARPRPRRRDAGTPLPGVRVIR
ncbi:unnamed protein product [Urochloa humidicola]